jgi:MFS family permease
MSESKAKTGPLLAVLIAGVLMGALDIAILSPALRFIQADFRVDERALSWIISVYVLWSLIGTPIMARFADLFGRRRVFIVDILLFAAGSLLVVFAGSFHAWWLLLLGRSIQGFGGGGIFPVAAATIGDVVAPEKRGAFLGALGAVFGLAFIVGPILGGILIPYGWNWLFLINLPIALVVIAAALRILPKGKPAAVHRIDLPGILALSAFLAAFSLAVNGLDLAHGLQGLGANRVPLWSLLALLFLALTILVERKSDHPLLPGQLFNRPRLRLAWAISIATGFAEASLAFIPTLALAAHGQAGLSASTASYLLLPLVIAMSIMSPLAGRALDRFGPRSVMLTGSSVMTLGFIGIALLSANLALLIAASVLVGGGIAALLGAPLRYLVLAETTEAERAVAQGLANMATSVGLAVGAAAIGAFAASGGGGARGYAQAFAAVAVAGTAAALLALALGKTPSRRAQGSDPSQVSSSPAAHG